MFAVASHSWIDNHTRCYAQFKHSSIVFLGAERGSDLYVSYKSWAKFECMRLTHTQSLSHPMPTTALHGQLINMGICEPVSIAHP